MADTPRMAPLGGPSGDRLNYKPISGLAIAALVISVGYSLFLLVLVIAAFLAKKPILIQELLILPVLGLILSIVGRIQIRNSEGTRIGLGFCDIAWWLSLGGGIAFAMYILATDLAVRRQAADTADKFMNSLKNDKWSTAFILTQDPLRSESLNPDDIEGLEATFGKNTLAAFRHSELSRLFHRYSGTDELRLINEGAKHWIPTPNGYDALESFQIICPEGIATTNLNLKGIEGPGIRGRKWFISIPPGENAVAWKTQTEYAVAQEELIREGAGISAMLITLLATGQSEKATAWLLPEPEQAKMKAQFDRRTFFFGSPILGVGVKSDLPPEFEKTFMRLMDGKEPNSEQLAFFRYFWKIGLIVVAGTHRDLANPEHKPIVTSTDAEFRVLLPVEIGTPTPVGGVMGARLALVATNPDFVAALAKLRKEGAAHPDKAAGPGTPITSLPPRDWKVAWIESSLEPLSSIPRERSQAKQQKQAPPPTGPN